MIKPKHIVLKVQRNIGLLWNGPWSKSHWTSVDELWPFKPETPEAVCSWWQNTWRQVQTSRDSAQVPVNLRPSQRQSWVWECLAEAMVLQCSTKLGYHNFYAGQFQVLKCFRWSNFAFCVLSLSSYFSVWRHQVRAIVWFEQSYWSTLLLVKQI